MDERKLKCFVTVKVTSSIHHVNRSMQKGTLPLSMLAASEAFTVIVTHGAISGDLFYLLQGNRSET